ncbi:MAG: glutamate--tRNA ligase [Candidatus Aminicenantes bacterium]|nr:glutamate--tRNA ligase [Candidatus Aminicenantes bacterium]RLE04120.1 MAG: glutamate--tRNA ligase [Candidatus Aminicenantes bacterium]HHF42101.1 glutamate--tRNA ligase [Candidatus Aminicenantes bacterium]
MSEVRVRFAPSPTGHLHLGAARTALFNWLFARHHGGKFILRIEDTDVERSSREMTQGIIEGLRWLGLDWDEGPYFQSDRLNLYQEKARALVAEGKAYFCYCLPEEIKERREKIISQGGFWRYDRRCYYLAEEDKRNFEAEGRAKAIRFLVPEAQEIEFNDLIHGRIKVKSQNIEDFVLLRSDGQPTYHLSVVVDDMAMKITHVIRGDDHISNTPKQILLYQAFGVSCPQFGHLPLILGPDKKKLSKRHGVSSILEYHRRGFLPLAVVNFLAQMSWAPGEEERVYSLEEMIEKFSLEKISKGSPVYNPSKLEWLNSQLISQTPGKELLTLIKERLLQESLWRDELEREKEQWFSGLLDLLKERSRTLVELVNNCRPFLSDEFPFDSEAVARYLTDPRLPGLLSKLADDFRQLKNFKADSIERALRRRAEQEGVKAAVLIHALRVLLLGMRVSPGIFDVLEYMGRDRTLQRMSRLAQVISQRSLEGKNIRD